MEVPKGRNFSLFCSLIHAHQTKEKTNQLPSFLRKASSIKSNSRNGIGKGQPILYPKLLLPGQ